MADVNSSLNSWSTTAASNSPSGSTSIGTGLDDNLREIQAVVRTQHATGTIASATTTDLSTVANRFVSVTGTTTITGLGTLTAGMSKWLIFGGALTFTHNGTSLILPGGANITTAAGDCALMESLGSGNWRCLAYLVAATVPGTVELSTDTSPQLGGDLDLNGNNIDFPSTANISDCLDEDDLSSDSATALATQQSIKAYADAIGIGQQTVWVPAAAMTSATTNGAAAGSTETSSNKVMTNTLDFDASTEEFSQFSIQMPKSWNESTLVVQFVWSHPETDTNFGVVWGIEATALADSDALDTAWGTEVATADTGGTTDDVFISPESSAVTVAGTPSAEEFVNFRITRVVGNGSDTMAVDARLHGVKIHYTVDATTDA